MIWGLTISLIVSVSGNVIAIAWLLRELRVSHQQSRSRVLELENERTTLINQVAEARGISMNDPTDPLGLSREKKLDFAIDPQTGNALYADGSVVAPDGKVLVEPGDGDLSVDVVSKVL